MKKYTILLFLTLFLCFPVIVGASVNKKGNDVIFKSTNVNLKLSFCSDNMVRIQKSLNGVWATNEQWMVNKYKFPPVDIKVQENSRYYSILTVRLDVRVDKASLALSILNRKEEVIYSELPAKNVTEDSVMDKCTMRPDEHFFGFGERMDFLDQRGKKIYLNVELGYGKKPAVGGKDILRANYCPVPFMLSNKGYGIFFHTAFPSTWDMGWTNKGQYSFAASGKVLDYYFIYGPDLYDVIDGYTDLTGKSPMLPHFAMGLHLGTYSGGGWGNESATSGNYPVELCRRMRKEKIPFDVLWLDSTWRLFNNDSYGNGGATFEWQSTFDNPKAMIDSVYAQHVSAMGLHIRSILDNGPKYKLLDAAKKNGVLCPHSQIEGTVNFFDPKAVDWWWKNAVMKVASIGIKFVKTDVGSALWLKDPEHDELYGMKSAQLHNIFPLVYAEAPYLKFQEYNHMRGLDHTREGYAGIQRYPYIWAGDWGSEWQWFESVIRGGLNIGMSGVGNWTHCMGGFEQYSPRDTDLYIRWVQFGMFSPVAMLFGADHPLYHEPWTYGKKALDIFIKYDSLRYALIPYIYTSEHQLYQTGHPMMSPLLLDYPDDENTYNISRQYMFGPYMMVCPVTTKGALSQAVYFPKGVWFDYETGEPINGHQYKSFLTPIETLPIYIKGGAIIPMQPEMQYAGEKAVSTVSLDVYPYGQSSYNLYEDDGVDLGYQNGVYAFTNITSNLEKASWSLDIAKPVGKYKPLLHNYFIKAYLPIKPVAVFENGKQLSQTDNCESVNDNGGKWYYDSSIKRVYINTDNKNNTDINIVVR